MSDASVTVRDILNMNGHEALEWLYDNKDEYTLIRNDIDINDLIQCWHCQKIVTLEARANNDGHCPICETEIDLEV